MKNMEKRGLRSGGGTLTRDTTEAIASTANRLPRARDPEVATENPGGKGGIECGDDWSIPAMEKRNDVDPNVEEGQRTSGGSGPCLGVG